jgi:hypothetical protein
VQLGNVTDDGAKVQPNKDLRADDEGTCSLLAVEAEKLPAELARLVEGWESLPDHVRAAVMMLTGGAKTS